VDTLDPNFDPLSARPAQFPARYTVHWVRSLDAETKAYAVQEYSTGTGDFAEMARLPAAEAWDFVWLTKRLDDGATYEWKIIPVDGAGNAQNTGSIVTTGGKIILRNPDAPNWNYTYEPVTDRVTFAAA